MRQDSPSQSPKPWAATELCPKRMNAEPDHQGYAIIHKRFPAPIPADTAHERLYGKLLAVPVRHEPQGQPCPDGLSLRGEYHSAAAPATPDEPGLDLDRRESAA